MFATQPNRTADATLAKKIRVVDTDIHCSLSRELLRKYLPEPHKSWGYNAVGGLGYHNPGGVHRADAVEANGESSAASPAGIARLLLDPFEIDVAVLTGDMYSVNVHPDPDVSIAVCSAYNDAMINEWLPKDPRFRLAMIVPTQDPVAAAREVDRVGGHPGIVEIIISSSQPVPLGQRCFHPLYAAAERQGLPIALHPGREGSGISAGPTAAGMATKYIEWHTGLTQTFQAHVISLVTEGVFYKYPKLKVVLTEGGVSWLPPLMWRLDKDWKTLRSTVPWLDRQPSKVIQDHFYLTTQPIEEPDNHQHLRQIFGMFNAEHMLMFSSDFPHWDGDTPDFAVRGFPESFKRRVLAENAIELFGL